MISEKLLKLLEENTRYIYSWQDRYKTHKPVRDWILNHIKGEGKPSIW